MTLELSEFPEEKVSKIEFQIEDAAPEFWLLSLLATIANPLSLSSVSSFAPDIENVVPWFEFCVTNAFRIDDDLLTWLVVESKTAPSLPGGETEILAFFAAFRKSESLLLASSTFPLIFSASSSYFFFASSYSFFSL